MLRLCQSGRYVCAHKPILLPSCFGSIWWQKQTYGLNLIFSIFYFLTETKFQKKPIKITKMYLHYIWFYMWQLQQLNFVQLHLHTPLQSCTSCVQPYPNYWRLYIDHTKWWEMLHIVLYKCLPYLVYLYKNVYVTKCWKLNFVSWLHYFTIL